MCLTRFDTDLIFCDHSFHGFVMGILSVVFCKLGMWELLFIVLYEVFDKGAYIVGLFVLNKVNYMFNFPLNFKNSLVNFYILLDYERVEWKKIYCFPICISSIEST